MHSELIEWRIAKVRKRHHTSGFWHFHVEGAQCVFGLTRARKIVKELGPGWEIRHAATFDLPKD